ncbi:MAG: DNA gyrase/topoisomerase IV subunit A, partial [Bacteroidaceae bacterium]|nr:DNA gyrase/topoisomerase IV subunit A [Bacteroidaceae bacterium]
SFDTIEASKVIEANEKLYINRADGFIGTSLKKDEFVSNCSNIDDVIIFYRDGTYKVTRVQEKVFVGETARSKAEKKKAEIIHIAVFKRNDTRTIYNLVYRDGKDGQYFIKRFNVTSITHDREYDVTTGAAGSKVLYFTANPNGEAEVIKVTLKPNGKLKKILFDRDFSEIMVKGKQSRGNLLTKNEIHKITLKSQGGSTLGGRQVWFDHDVQRLNYDNRGEYLGEFHSDDSILVVLTNGEFYTTNFDVNNHYEQNILRIEKFDEQKVWTAVLFDADQQGFPYIKRFTMERTSANRHQSFIGENPKTELLLVTDTVYPRILVTHGGADSFREPIEIDAEQFIGAKSFKAKGKRITTLEVASIEELEPTRFPAPKEDDAPADTDVPTPEEETDENPNDVRDELIGQLHFDLE